jgi:uncharacterized protein (DUF1330 family)
MENLPMAKGPLYCRRYTGADYEAGVKDRTVIIEFDTVAQAVACDQSAAYCKALEVLDNAADRDIRIIGGVDEQVIRALTAAD